MPNAPVEFKGSNFILSVIYLHNEKPKIIRQALEEKIAQAPSFLKHAPVVINVSDLVSPINWKMLQKEICETGLRIIGISGCKDDQLKAELDQACLPLLLEGKEAFISSVKKIKIPSEKGEAISRLKKTKLIDIPIRSGQCVYAQNCDLVVTNHVSSGAELVADGNIHIYGMMRGRVLAGASGDCDVQIFCTNLLAELISIAGVYCLSDQIPSKFYGRPARIRLLNHTLIVNPLN